MAIDFLSKYGNLEIISGFNFEFISYKLNFGSMLSFAKISGFTPISIKYSMKLLSSLKNFFSSSVMDAWMFAVDDALDFSSTLCIFFIIYFIFLIILCFYFYLFLIYKYL